MNETTMRLVAGAATALLGLTAFAVPASAVPERPSSAAIAAVVEANLGPIRLPGVAVVVVENGELVHTGGYGRDSHGEPITSATPMRIASLSKSFTALAVMQLAEAGTIGLDDPVMRYLPEFSMADPRADRITIRHLLDHSSGMSDSSYPESALPQPDSLREAVADLRHARLDAAPGERHAYHNPNYWVAARLVEAVSGQQFAEYLDRHVFTPLHMDSTVTVDNSHDPVPRLSDGHNRFLGITWPRREPERFVAGSAGIVTTADDLARWLMLHTARTTSTVLSASGIDELHRPSAPDGHYALGWDNPDTSTGQRQVSHSGSSFTSTANMVLLPGSGYGIGLLSNSRMPLEADAEAIMEDLIALTRGVSPEGYRLPLAFIAELSVLAAAVSIVVGGGRKARRARDWAARRKAAASRPRVVLGLATCLVPLPVFVFLPHILELVTGGRTVTFLLLSHVWPTFLAAVGATAAVGAVVAAARILALRELATAARSRTGVDGADA
ncbi:serine hydrolase domain-containing protein [Nocardia cyriacigeorgica]|uniref:serine hydrolase domain-containing protein n=1 Tax=Nocardia cyriacigeorgica TaxID=135487 RepID=UPI002457D2A3|nr:serine hydrolase domain-containing protein [Nocardia cyriacigeorgica]